MENLGRDALGHILQFVPLLRHRIAFASTNKTIRSMIPPATWQSVIVDTPVYHRELEGLILYLHRLALPVKKLFLGCVMGGVMGLQYALLAIFQDFGASLEVLSLIEAEKGNGPMNATRGPTFMYDQLNTSLTLRFLRIASKTSDYHSVHRFAIDEVLTKCPNLVELTIDCALLSVKPESLPCLKRVSTITANCVAPLFQSIGNGSCVAWAMMSGSVSRVFSEETTRNVRILGWKPGDCRVNELERQHVNIDVVHEIDGLGYLGRMVPRVFFDQDDGASLRIKELKADYPQLNLNKLSGFEYDESTCFKFQPIDPWFRGIFVEQNVVPIVEISIAEGFTALHLAGEFAFPNLILKIALSHPFQ
jgi:hypothetical protein